MKNKTSLALMEQAIMILVFALAAALCLRAFVWADITSARNTDREQALTQVQTAAELLKHYTGDRDAVSQALVGSVQDVYYDEQWNPVPGEGAWKLVITPLSGQPPFLGSADVAITDSTDQILAQLQICWQEVAP
jgi:hypothetical protein